MEIMSPPPLPLQQQELLGAAPGKVVTISLISLIFK